MNQLNESLIDKCINSLGTKFLERAANFFTESDAHSFLYSYMLRSSNKEFKLLHSTKDQIKTILVHREYPTSYRFDKKSMKKTENKGKRGHYDLVILNPDFVNNYNYHEVAAQNFNKYPKQSNTTPLLAAVEFKLIRTQLGQNVFNEIEKDFQKLQWAIDMGQAKSAYMIILNRETKENKWWSSLSAFERKYPNIKGMYIESLLKKDASTAKRHYGILYINETLWTKTLRNKRCK